MKNQKISRKQNMMVCPCILFLSHRSIFLFASLVQKSLPSFPQCIQSQLKKKLDEEETEYVEKHYNFSRFNKSI